MKKIGMDELYLLSEIADKIEFETPNIYDTKGNRKDQYQYGSEMLLGLFKKMYKAKKEINDLIYKVTEKKAETRGQVFTTRAFCGPKPPRQPMSKDSRRVSLQVATRNLPQDGNLRKLG